MPLAFENLDHRTRELMLGEVDRDLAEEGSLYESPRLTAAGAAGWKTLFRAACQTGSDASLAAALGAPGNTYINAREPSSTSRTGDKAVPVTAATTMAEGEFNRFYIRAMCVRALEDGVELEIYRARASQNPDYESEAKIGQSPDASALLADLRSHQGVATALGLPPHPNSGLSVRLRI